MDVVDRLLAKETLERDSRFSEIRAKAKERDQALKSEQIEIARQTVPARYLQLFLKWAANEQANQSPAATRAMRRRSSSSAGLCSARSGRDGWSPHRRPHHESNSLQVSKSALGSWSSSGRGPASHSGLLARRQYGKTTIASRIALKKMMRTPTRCRLRVREAGPGPGDRAQRSGSDPQAIELLANAAERSQTLLKTVDAKTARASRRLGRMMG